MPAPIEVNGQLYYMWDGQRMGPFGTPEDLNADLDRRKQEWIQKNVDANGNVNGGHIPPEIEGDVNERVHQIRLEAALGVGMDTGGYGALDPRNEQIFNTWSKGMTGAIEHPGISAGTEQQMVNASTEGLNEAEQGDQLHAKELAGAMGFGESGDRMTASREIGQNYAAKRGAAERDTRLGVENQRQQQLLQALGIGSGYLGTSNNIAAAAKNRQQDVLLNYIAGGGDLDVLGGNGNQGGTGGPPAAGGNPPPNGNPQQPPMASNPPSNGGQQRENQHGAPPPAVKPQIPNIPLAGGTMGRDGMAHAQQQTGGNQKNQWGVNVNSPGGQSSDLYYAMTGKIPPRPKPRVAPGQYGRGNSHVKWT